MTKKEFNKITKADFEQQLIEKYDFDGLTFRRTDAFLPNGKSVKLNLYYYNHEHIATWSRNKAAKTWMAV